jgi:hypothetical protein
MSYGLVSTTRWVEMSENRRVSMILKMNGYLPYVEGTEGSAAPKIVINPFFRNIMLYGEYMSFAKVFINETLHV